jgi:solute carrier family 25 protein 39/40
MRLSSVIAHEHRKHQGISFLVHFVSGAASGTIAAVLTTPIDVIKTNAQVSHLTPSRKHKNAWDIFRNIVMEEGWRGLTKGVVPRAVKVAPACAIMISSYELLKAVNHDGS